MTLYVSWKPKPGAIGGRVIVGLPSVTDGRPARAVVVGDLSSSTTGLRAIDELTTSRWNAAKRRGLARCRVDGKMKARVSRS